MHRRPGSRFIACTWLFLWALKVGAAEYSQADDIPQTTSLLFTEGAVALTLEPYFMGSHVRETDRTLYFVTERSSDDFRRVSHENFERLKSVEHVQEWTHGNTAKDFEVSTTDDCSKLGYRYDTGSQDLIGRTSIQFPSATFKVGMLCRSTISDAVRVNDELWIGTYEQGGHGEYGAEGVLVVSEDGASMSRIDVGHTPVENIAIDPWSSDVWVVTRSQLTLVSERKQVKARYWKYHDFDFSRNRPDVFVVASDKPVYNNPLAVLATWLGESSFDGLARAHRNGVTLPGREPLYNLAMFGNYFAPHNHWPEELDSLLDKAEPTLVWRRFACLVRGERAKELCQRELEDWPASEP